MSLEKFTDSLQLNAWPNFASRGQQNQKWDNAAIQALVFSQTTNSVYCTRHSGLLVTRRPHSKLLTSSTNHPHCAALCCCCYRLLVVSSHSNDVCQLHYEEQITNTVGLVAWNMYSRLIYVTPCVFRFVFKVGKLVKSFQILVICAQNVTQIVEQKSFM